LCRELVLSVKYIYSDVEVDIFFTRDMELYSGSGSGMLIKV